MDDITLTPEMLAYLVFRLRHAISNGESVTVNLLQDVLSAYESENAPAFATA